MAGIFGEYSSRRSAIVLVMSSSIPVTVDPPAPAPGPSSTPSSSWPFSLYDRLQAWRRSLDLPNPGSSENVGKECKSELATLSHVVYL